MKILTFSVMFFVVGCCFSCLCRNWPFDIEKEYCRSESAIRGKPIQVNYTENWIVYKVEVAKAFKAADNVKVGDIVPVVTSRRTSCGSRLSLNEDYVIISNLFGGSYWIETCSFHSSVQYLTEKELTLLEDGIKC